MPNRRVYFSVHPPVWQLFGFDGTPLTDSAIAVYPFDNACCECFFKYLKKEELDRRHFHSLDQLKQSLLTYIDGFYNPIRPHSHNHGLSPVQAENFFFQLFTCPNS